VTPSIHPPREIDAIDGDQTSEHRGRAKCLVKI
jgi:hypothetical protein